MQVSAPDIDAALDQARARMHPRVVLTAVAGSATVGGMLVYLLWQRASAAVLLPWVAGLALVLVLRLTLGLAQDRDRSAEQHAAIWLRLHRGAFALHGLVWAVACVALVPRLGRDQLDPVVFALTAITAGVLLTASFDLLAALVFAGPPMLLAALMVMYSHEDGGVLSAMLLMFLGITGASAWRAQRALRDTVRLQLEQLQRAAEVQQHGSRADTAQQQLADHHQLMTQLMQTTQQGFWFVDNDGVTTDVNPAMASLLGRPREQIVGRSLFDFFDGSALVTVRAEFEGRREHPAAGSYEVALSRPDGNSVHCVNQATPLFDSVGAHVGNVGLFTDISARRAAEGLLRMHAMAINSITDMVSVADEHEVYQLVNDAWCRATGVARADAVGRASTAVLPGGVSAERRTALQGALVSGQPRVARGAAELRGLPGRLLETTYYPYPEGGAGLRCVAIVTRDITDQAHALQRLQATDAEQRALLDAFPGYISRLDEQLVYTYANARAAALVGTTPAAMIGRHVSELLGAERAAMLRDAAARVWAGESVVYQRPVAGPDSASRAEVEVTLAASRDPATGARALIGFGIDITARKCAEAALIAARDEAERANRAKSQFLAQMSHELRTPLNAILGFGQLLETEIEPGSTLPPPAPERQLRQVREMLRGARHLLELINEILDLGRIEAGKLQLQTEPLPLAPLLDECIALMHALALERHVQLHPVQLHCDDLSVRGDRTRLKQVLLNLLGNAIKYNRRGGKVSVQCSVHGASVQVAVHDTGRGLTAAEQARLFQPFERLDAAQSGIEGTGIGLALSRRLVEAMGGEIGVTSEAGVGSRFWLRLPAVAAATGHADSAATAQPAPADVPDVQQQRTVLYIEDNAVNVVLMEAMLARLPGLHFVSAEMPEDGLAIAAQQHPALILLDIQLPGIDGFEVLRRLRAQDGTRAIPVIAVSANAVPEDIAAALAAGFDAYLTKPLELHALLTTVQRWCG